MKETVFLFDPSQEFFTPEGCYVLELSNSAEDPEASIAQARVAPGATTRWHRVRDTVERYIILEGGGRVEVGGLLPRKVNPGDVVLIPPAKTKPMAFGWEGRGEHRVNGYESFSFDAKPFQISR